MMKMWVMYSLMAAFSWGLWGFFSKLATRSLNTTDILLAAAIGEFLLLLAYLISMSKDIHFQWMSIDFGFAVLGGLAMMAGFVLFYRALSIGEVTPIVIITACYPLVTLGLAYMLLKEPFSLQKIVGAFLTVSGICLISL